ncbi:MAG: hypothetical protein ABIP41_07860 [Croceibacterium sp.]
MSAVGAALACAAEQFIGAPFRLHGRDPATGLDCVGVIAAALQAIGRDPVVPSGYALRQCDVGGHLHTAEHNAFAPASGSISPGDLLLVRPGPAQHHLLVAGSSGGFIHAHAGLRRVVHAPPPLQWPILRHWRLDE